ncbi:atherin-like [Vidua chalybeata]|uniref:atherin-like n=1 Tax=Vidua chalybeata TaxID=81927 RepID=UPI0023A90F79|nr:atherin-like [Vidua chalybeata]
MDDDDEDEDEDGDGDPDAPPAPAAPLLLTSASSTSASHRWPQPPPTSTVRHIDTATDRPPPPPLPRPHTAPAPPAHRRPPAQTPIRRLADLTGWAGAAPGCGETAERGPDGTRRHGELRAPHPAPRPGRCPSAPPPSPRPCYFFLFISPWKRKSPFGCERPLRGGESPPLPAHGLRSVPAGRGSGGSAPCPPRRRSLPPSPAEPPGRRLEPGGGSAPLPPAARLRLGAVEAGAAAGAPGDGKEGGSRVQRCVRGRQSLGSVAAFQQLRLEQLRALGAGGGSPGRGPAGWLPARPAAGRG